MQFIAAVRNFLYSIYVVSDELQATSKSWSTDRRRLVLSYGAMRLGKLKPAREFVNSRN